MVLIYGQFDLAQYLLNLMAGRQGDLFVNEVIIDGLNMDMQSVSYLLINE